MQRFSGMLLILVSAAGLLLLAVPNGLAQSSVGGESWLSTSESTTYHPTAEAFLVRATLDQFDSALAVHDVEGLQAVGVKRVSAKGWRRFFRNNPNATVTDECPVSELSISAGVASWTCTETVTILSEGRPKSFPHTIHFTFAKHNGVWMVADRR
jgi:hypothetical protein